MVATQFDDGRGERRFVLRPNVACNWRQSLRFFVVLAAVCLAIAGCFTWMGYWPILPFAGLEVTVLGAALYVSARRAGEAEVVRITARRVVIEKGCRRPERRWIFERVWSEVVVTDGNPRWYPRILTVRSRGEEIPIGRFLGEEELERLACELRYWVGPMAAEGAAFPGPGIAKPGIATG